MKSWTVYKHISPNGKVYVGISSNIKNRWAADGYYYRLSDTIFSRALIKYGWDNFQHIIFKEGLTKREACDMEKELIAYYKAKGISYNITDGGEGYSGRHSNEQIRHRLESRLANSTTEYLVIDRDFNYIVCATEREAAEFLDGTQGNIAHILKQPIGYTFKKHYIWKHTKGSPVDIDSIKSKIQEALALRRRRQYEIGKIYGGLGANNLRKTMQTMTSEERKMKYGHGEKLLGRHHSEETRKKIAEKAKGRDMSKVIEARKQHPYYPTHTKPVIQYLTTGELVNEFESITIASKETGITKTGINNCLQGRSKSSGGYRWQYKN